MSKSIRGETCKRDIDSSPSAVSPNSKSPESKKLHFAMPPKPRIIRTKPELTGDGDAVLRELHNQHWNNHERVICHPEVKTDNHTKLLNELYIKYTGQGRRT